MCPSDSDPGNIKPIPETKDSIAIAIEQSGGKNSVPKVIAGGRGDIARQILEIAFQNGIKVREDADLAELLSAVDVESEIPLDAFAAVAEILTYVYQINNAMAPDEDETQDPETNPKDTPDMNDSERHTAQELAALWGRTAGADK
jgi:flagellar biosynthesis protein